MNHFFTSHSARIHSAVVLAALASGGLFSTVQAQPRTAPLPGWPGNQTRDNRWGNDPWNEREVMSGEVTKRYSNTEYDLRAGDGHTFRVRSDDSLYLNRGDEVRVSGDWRGQTFYARTITLVDRDNGFGNWGDRGDWNNGFRTRTDIYGVVAQRFGTQTFEVRTNTGRTYLVRSDTSSTPNLRSGDRVRIVGTINGNRIRASLISNLSGNGGIIGGGRGGGWDNRFPDNRFPNNNGGGVTYGNGGGGWGVNGGYVPPGGYNPGGYDRGGADAGTGLDVDFPGRIESIDRTGREATVRGENGRTYTVRASQNELEGYRTGDRIRVRGVVRNDYISATDLDRIR